MEARQTTRIASTISAPIKNNKRIRTLVFDSDDEDEHNTPDVDEIIEDNNGTATSKGLWQTNEAQIRSRDQPVTVTRKQLYLLYRMSGVGLFAESLVLLEVG
ncbi:hypothetical protein HK100_004418 [Physocladia obscura]|uniref:Uncharacterized protein n=1 Tax=Physocladia obscura TaxID=109957 RepID=A0AAD5X8R9_9FUNG|nr:hypothetical protein HK100_004418 [Physocladia obscura]